MSVSWDLANAGRVYVGTASWTERTMLTPDLFYPKGVSSAEERLRFYASEFPIVEVDASYYALPSERNSELWAERTPSGFRFNVKAFSLLTHHPTKIKSLPPDLRDAVGDDKPNVYLRDAPSEVVERVWDMFTGALKPMGPRLRAVLFQFPKWFLPGRDSRAYLTECRDRMAEALPDVQCAVEFRAAAWMSDEDRQKRTLDFLAELETPYVCVDMPQGFSSSVPPVVAVTAPLAMVRFHGRRAETWDKRGIGPSERFRWDYSADELSEWVPSVQRLAGEAEEVHVLMNNCYRDYAVRSARKMTSLLLDA